MAAIDLQIKEEVRALADAIGLRPGFYERLLSEPSDWAFLVQLQVLVEAALAERIVRALKRDQAFDHVSRLALDGKTGKLQLALSLGVLDPDSADVMRALAACRNRFAHRTSTIGATLEKFGESLDAATKLDLLKKLGALDPDDEGSEQAAGFPGFGAKLRHRIWLSTAIALAMLADKALGARLVPLQREMESAQRDSASPVSTPRSLLDFNIK